MPQDRSEEAKQIKLDIADAVSALIRSTRADDDAVGDANTQRFQAAVERLIMML